MSLGPRIVFARFVDGDSPKLVPWVSHLRRTLGQEPCVLGDLRSGAVVWQLVSGNNRQLGRSSRIFASFEDATTDAQRSMNLAGRLEATFVSEHQRGVYGWFTSINGEAAMVCARWYETERDRARSIALALPSMEAAVLHRGTRLVDVTLLTESASG